jgi:hypothetical protein
MPFLSGVKGFTDRNSVLCLLMTWMFLHSTRGILSHHRGSKDIEIERNEKV